MSDAAPEAAVIEAEPDETTVVVVPPAEPEPEPAEPTTVVVSDTPDPSDAVKEATAIDHAERITRLEDVAVFLGREIEARPTREEVAAMTPTREQVAEVASAAAEAAVTEAEPDEPEPGEGVRIPEPEGDPVLGTVTPDTVPAEGGDAVANEKPKARHALLKW